MRLVESGARRALLALVAIAAACTDAPTALPPPGAVDLAAPWRAATAESVDMDPGALFVAGELGTRVDRLRSLVVVRRGRVVLERYYGGATSETLADVRSVTKSVVSTLVGIAVEEGYIDGLDEPITRWLRRPRFPVQGWHSAVTIRHLLTMTGGFEWSESGTTEYNVWIASPDQIAYLLDKPEAAPPGTDFTYNSAAVHLLGVILEEATGMPLPQYADRVLFGPLGIPRRAWEELPSGRVNGGAGLDLRPRDLARLGQLFLQEGWSGTRRLLPPGWAAEATSPTLSAFPGVGPIDLLSYGYLWWLDMDLGAYLAWGYAGQFVYVLPSEELVVVATTEWRQVTDDVGPSRLQAEVLGLIVDRVVTATR